MEDIDEVIFSLEAEANIEPSDGNGISVQVTGGIGDTIGYTSGDHFLLTGEGFDDVTGGTGIDIVLGGAGEDVLRGGGGNDNVMFERIAA